MFFTKKVTNTNTPNTAGFVRLDASNSFSIERAKVCFLKGLLIFMASYGTIFGLLTCFDAPHYPVLLVIFLLVFSFSLAFLHYNKILFNLLYPLFFLLFAYSIFKYRTYVNVGYQSFLNIIYNSYSSYFDLSTTREINSVISTTEMTITMAMIFLGFFLCILLNIAISTYMNFFFLILLTFPFLQIGLYIGNVPDIICYFFLFGCYITVGILGKAGHFTFPTSKKENQFFSTKHSKKMTTNSYLTNGTLLLQIFFFSIGLTTIFMLFAAGSLSTQKQTHSNNLLKNTTDQYVKIFVQSGVSGWFNRYPNYGGLLNGSLGGVGTVRPDYQTDLVVTLAPYSFESVYLKTFTGQRYTSDSWLPPTDTPIYPGAKDLESYNQYQMDTAFMESQKIEEYCSTNQFDGMRGKMKIQNVDTFSGQLFLPYYALSKQNFKYSVDQSLISGSIPYGESITVDYYPYESGYWNNISATASSTILDPSKDTESYYAMRCQMDYLDVPAELENLLQETKDKIGYSDNRETQVALIKSYFIKNFKYTLSPGATPTKEDFVSYFLSTQKRGYCSHFASAATLLLRSYGIPARYVEGYVVTPIDIENGTILNTENYSDWLTGEVPIPQTAVVETQISDANAHAWVEVYYENFGFVPFEVTPPSEEASAEGNTGFFNLFSNLFSTTPLPNTTNVTTTEVTQNPFDQLVQQNSYFFQPVFFVLLFIILVPIVFLIVRKALFLIVITAKFGRGDISPRLIYYYKKLQKTVQKNQSSPTNLLPLEVFEQSANPLNTKLSWEDSLQQFEKACYSKDALSIAAAKELIQYLKHANLAYKKNVRTKKKS